VYSRILSEKIITLSASGWTYKNTFVLYDYETESLWYHLPEESRLTCISGTYADRHLSEFKSIQIRWSEWVAINPETQILTE